MGKWIRFASGVIAGAALYAGLTATARAVSGVCAEQVRQEVFVDGQMMELDAYEIEGSNYVRLRDVGRLLDFNVYWDDGIFIDSSSPYTGEPPEEVLQNPQTPKAGAPGEEADLEAIRQEMVELTNALRMAEGLPALPQDGKLMEAAQVRAEEMAATGEYSHTRPDGSSRSTVTDCIYTAENIHCISARRLTNVNQELAGLAVEDWAASQIHLEAMLDNRRSAIGVGVARGVDPETGKECWYCVQWFMREGYQITWVDEPILER